MDSKMLLHSEGFTGIYKELADVIGAENTYAVYESMRGQQATFPKRLYTTEYALGQIRENYTGNNIKKLAVQFDYTEKHLRQLLKKLDEIKVEIKAK